MESRLNKSEEMNRDVPDSVNIKGKTILYKEVEANNDNNTDSNNKQIDNSSH